MTWYADELYARLKEIGEADVRTQLAQGGFSSDKVPLVQEWLRQREDARSNTTLSRQEKRDLEANELAREANDIALSARKDAREANRIARSARIIAIIAAIAAVIAAIAAIITIFLPPKH